MPWAAGSYTKGNAGTGGWTGDQGRGTGIEAGLHDTQDNDFTTGINSTLTKDGSNVPSANLPMGGFRHTGVGLATARDSYATLGQAQDGTAIWGGASGGTANAQTLTLSPAITAYAAGQRFGFVAGFTNTAATTLNVNGVGAVNIIATSSGVSIASNYLAVGRPYQVLYNGSTFELLDDPALTKTGGYDYLGQSTGTANALVLTSTGPKITSTAIYKTFIFATNLANTGATTVAIDGLTAINVLNPDTSALRSGQLQASRFYQLILINGTALLANPDQSWQTWTPAITQGVAVTSTIQEATYKISSSNEVTAVFKITATSAGTGGSAVSVSLPINAAWSADYSSIGDAIIYDVSLFIGYTCSAVLNATTTISFASWNGTNATNYFGAQPNLALANGDFIAATITYRI